MTVQSGARLGPYEIVTLLGRGGMGEVYRALDTRVGRIVAIKVLPPDAAEQSDRRQRFEREAKAVARLNHPHICALYDVGRQDGVEYLVMEYLDGETLGSIHDRGPIELATIIAITAQVAAALAALHGAGFVHCDVKHDNVFVLDETVAGWPRVKVIDFGVSRAVDEPPLEDAAIAGTPWCMAPEQWSGAPSTKSDVYALGCMLYDLTTGAPPFDGSLPELMIAHLEQRPARPSWLRAMPSELERIILRALAKDPEARPTMEDIAQGLTELMDLYTPVEVRRAG